MAWRRVAKHGVGVALLLCFIAVALRVVRTTATHPWDFLTYGYASLAVQKGLDPYNVETLFRLAHRPVGMPFVYPLVTVPVFMPFLGLRIPQAVSLWLAINVAALTGMLLIWRRHFLPSTSVVLIGVAIAPIRRAWTARDPARWVMLSAILFVLLHPRPMALVKFRYADPWAPNLPFLLLLALWMFAAVGEAMERSGRSGGLRIYRAAPE